MSTSDDGFGTLRSLLQETPSSTHFRAVFDHLLAHADHDALDEVWLPYAADCLKSWPDRTRSRGPLYKTEELAELERHEGITRLVRHLRFGRHTTGQLRDIVENPAFSDLTGISMNQIDGYQLGEKVRALLQGSPLPKLRRLDFSSSPYFKEEGSKALVEHLNQPEIEELNLTNCGLGARALKAMLKHSHVLRLRTLNLAMNQLGPGGARALEKAKGLERLEQLDLFGTTKGRIKSAGVEAIARSSHLKTLKFLGLRDQHIEDAGVVALTESAHLTGLESLTLTYNRISGDALAAMCHAPNLAHIKRLLVSGNHEAGDLTARAIATSPTMTQLAKLDISQTALGDDAFIALIESPIAQQFTTLCAYRNKLTNRSAEALLAAKLPNLTGINLNNAGIDQPHTKKLAQHYKIIAMA